MFGKRRERVGSIAFGQVFVERRAVRVGRGAFGPIGEAAIHPIERLERVFAACGLLDGPEIAGVQPSFARHHALFVHRKAFNLPDWQKEVRKGQRHAAEHAADGARPSKGSIEMEDVRVLVRENEPEPVVGEPDEIASGRPCGGDEDGVVRHRRCQPVGQLGLIDEHDVCLWRRRDAERLLQGAPRLLGDRRQSSGGARFSLVEVDDEVRSRQGPEGERGIDHAGRAGRPAGEQERRSHDAGDPPSVQVARRATHRAGRGGRRATSREDPTTNAVRR